MSLLKHRPHSHSAMAPENRRSRRPRDATHVRVLPSPQADEEEHTQVFARGVAPDPIEALLLAVANGDSVAFAALEDRIAGIVRVNVRRVLRDASRSDAVTRQFFAEVLQDLTTFDSDRDSAQSWLLTRAHVRATNGLTPAEAASP